MLRFVACFVIIGLMISPVTTHAAAPTGTGLLNRLNHARVQAKRPLLRDSYTLRRAAASRAADMIRFGYFSHVSATGLTYRSWLANGPARFNKTGENIARGYATSLAMVTGWLASGSHRQNLLDPEFTHAGTAIRPTFLNGRPTYLYVTVFGRVGK